MLHSTRCPLAPRSASPDAQSVSCGNPTERRPRERAWAQPPRRGAAAVLITVMLFVFVVTTAITVDYAYMQLVRTELRSATDAAAKAGAEALARTQDPAKAKQEAVRYAAANSVGGQSFRLREDDVVLGRVNLAQSGRWEFQAGAAPPNAVRINARTGNGAAQPAVPLFFSGVIGKSGFTPSYQATAGQQQVEVCLCLDRSGSMDFDMSGQEWAFPPNNPKLCNFTQWGWDWQNMLSPPHPTDSRWAALRRAINAFFKEADNYYPQPRTALVTWGSDYTMPVSPFTVYPAASTDYPLPSTAGFSWNANVTAIKGIVNAKGDAPIMGSTNLSAGLDEAIGALTGASSNSSASKVIVLLTDGQWNEGRNPILSAQEARAQGIIVHCVSMLTAKQSDLEQIASITGGRYYSTQSSKELRDAFAEIAKSLPVVLTE